MPLVNYESWAAFDADGYKVRPERYLGGHPGNRPEITLPYSRAGFYPVALQRANTIALLMNWFPPGPSIVVVGSGFGWLVEVFELWGFTRIIGVDTSNFIQTNQSATEENRINAAIIAAGLDPNTGVGALRKGQFFDGGPISRTSRGIQNEDIRNNAARGRIKQKLGLQGNAQPDWVLTEDMICVLNDTEFLELATAADNWVGNTLHFVPTSQPGDLPDPTFNPHTILEWSAMAPTHYFIEKQNPIRVIRDGVVVTF